MWKLHLYTYVMSVETEFPNSVHHCHCPYRLHGYMLLVWHTKLVQLYMPCCNRTLTHLVKVRYCWGRFKQWEDGFYKNVDIIMMFSVIVPSKQPFSTVFANLQKRWTTNISLLWITPSIATHCLFLVSCEPYLILIILAADPTMQCELFRLWSTQYSIITALLMRQ